MSKLIQLPDKCVSFKGFEDSMFVIL